MNFDNAFAKLMARIEEVERLLNYQSRMVNNVMREGKVLKVYPGEGVAEVKIFGEGSRTQKMSWFTQSGAIKDFVPPSEGQRVMVFSPSGDPARGVIMPGGYSKDFAKPHDQGDEAMRTIGDSSDLMTGAKRRIVADDIELVGRVHITGELLEHNEKNVGDDHEHKDVTPGGGLTGPPK